MNNHEFNDEPTQPETNDDIKCSNYFEEDSDEPNPEKYREIEIDEDHSVYFIGSHKLSWRNWTRYYFWFWYEAHGKYYCSPSPYYDDWIVFDKMPEFIGACIVSYDETKKKTFMALECCDKNCEDCWINGKIEIVGEFCYYKDNDDHKIYFAYSHYLGEFGLCRDEDDNYIENIISFEYHQKNHTDYFVIKTESGDYYSVEETSSRFTKLNDYPNDIGEN